MKIKLLKRLSSGLFRRGSLLFFAAIFVPLTIRISQSVALPLYNTSFTSGAGGSVLVIDGPQGAEQFEFGFHIDAYGLQFISDRGVVFGNAEATSDPFFYAARYGVGGYVGRFYGGNGSSWASENGAMLSLGWDYCGTVGYASYCNDVPLATGIDSSGVARGQISHYLDDGTNWLETKTWFVEPFVPVPISEPNTMLLLGAGLLGATGLKIRKI